ncbi:type II toxin-antitoxin system Phd/YefM family antitoxin [Psychrobacter sp. I-STPA10]|uniref:type II toxin-antitoxin system Phd/YefM family antitoxin n=1 Tax=Psychrobacter sp. I-STPA10 TaxID=2585769 RepID=UPI001E3A87D9|nr:type II toxin-antitoxin system Phd/YefM family antitoxin [Psychrobacter sp. I-STPA10]
MLTWSVQNAKARFSELLDTCIHSEPQVVTKRGQEVAVLVSIEEWKRLQSQAKPTLKELLLSDTARFDLPDTRQINHQKTVKRRALPEF